LYDLLTGIRVLDLTSLLPGPFATLLLADLGAEVIKIEQPPQGDPVRGVPPFVQGKSVRFLALNRNKKSVTLNLKMPQGRAVYLQMAQTADIVMEGFRPGVSQRLEIDYPHVKRANPDIIYGSLTGYGQQSPYRAHVGHDINYTARAGLLSLTGQTPVLPGVPVADLAGAMFAVCSVLAALRARDQGRGGTFLDIPLTDSVISWLSLHFAEYLGTQETPRPQELILTGGYPCYHIYETRDGKYLSVGALEEKFWAKFCNALGVPEYISYQFALEKREEIFSVITGIFRSKTQAQWLRELDPQEIPIAPVLDLAEVMQDPQVRERGLIREDALGIAFPVRMGDSQEKKDRSAPELGEHTREVLEALGYSLRDIEQLRRDGVT
jgi:crotonobetainyl-CoA:carnitine CoA-transferase CaiB-like acyl-CoA transferase